MTPRVLVLLSTYNGEKYIKQQLDSILNQHNVEVKLLIRDDNSKDASVAILQDYANRYPEKIDLIYGENIGCSQSFYQLISIAFKQYKDFDYYSFSDQDDVWLPDKLYSGVKALNKVPCSLKTYYCQPCFVDEELKPIIAKGFINNRSTLAESFLVSPSIGCAMIFSPEVLKQLSLHCEDGIRAMHDSLTYKLTLALGGVIIEDPIPHILYRQHSGNTIGNVKARKTRFKRWIKAFINTERKKSIIASDILKFYSDSIPPQEAQTLSLLDGYVSSISKKIRLLFSKDFTSNSRLHNVMFRVAVLFNKF